MFGLAHIIKSKYDKTDVSPYASIEIIRGISTVTIGRLLATRSSSTGRSIMTIMDLAELSDWDTDRIHQSRIVRNIRTLRQRAVLCFTQILGFTAVPHLTIRHSRSPGPSPRDNTSGMAVATVAKKPRIAEMKVKRSKMADFKMDVLQQEPTPVEVATPTLTDFQGFSALSVGGNLPGLATCHDNHYKVLTDVACKLHARFGNTSQVLTPNSKFTAIATDDYRQVTYRLTFLMKDVMRCGWGLREDDHAFSPEELASIPALLRDEMISGDIRYIVAFYFYPTMSSFRFEEKRGNRWVTLPFMFDLEKLWRQKVCLSFNDDQRLSFVRYKQALNEYFVSFPPENLTPFQMSFEIIEDGFVGGGGHGEVYLCRTRPTIDLAVLMRTCYKSPNMYAAGKSWMAVKLMSTSYESTVQEKHFGKLISHSGVVEVFMTVTERVAHHKRPEGLGTVYQLMEIAGSSGDLNLRMARGSLTEEYVSRTLRSVFQALAFMHSSLNVIHRDLKTSNLLLFEGDWSSSGHEYAKICDFGACLHIAPLTQPVKRILLNERALAMKPPVSGTFAFLSPEAAIPVGELLLLFPSLEHSYGDGGRLWTSEPKQEMSLTGESLLPPKPQGGWSPLVQYYASQDMWAMGATVYLLLCGVYPFNARDCEEFKSILLDVAVTVPMDGINELLWAANAIGNPTAGPYGGRTATGLPGVGSVKTEEEMNSLADSLSIKWSRKKRWVWEQAPAFRRLSPDAKDFISRLLVVDPMSRMTAEEACVHPFLTSF